jgi:hypothetical protein
MRSTQWHADRDRGWFKCAHGVAWGRVSVNCRRKWHPGLPFRNFQPHQSTTIKVARSRLHTRSGTYTCIKQALADVLLFGRAKDAIGVFGSFPSPQSMRREEEKQHERNDGPIRTPLTISAIATQRNPPNQAEPPAWQCSVAVESIDQSALSFCQGPARVVFT